MLREIQSTNNASRRWFNDTEMDLFVWTDDNDVLRRFELSYDKKTREKAMSWDREHGFVHVEIDDGGGRGKHPGSPIHATRVPSDPEYIIDQFMDRAIEVERLVFDQVLEHLRDYAGETRPPSLERDRKIENGRPLPIWLWLAGMAGALALTLFLVSR